jgi:hypothetical protein
LNRWATLAGEISTIFPVPDFIKSSKVSVIQNVDGVKSFKNNLLDTSITEQDEVEISIFPISAGPPPMETGVEGVLPLGGEKAKKTLSAMVIASFIKEEEEEELNDESRRKWKDGNWETCPSPGSDAAVEGLIARGVRFHRWDTGDGFTPELPGGSDASLLDDIKGHYDDVLAELKARPELATVSYAGLPLGGRSQRQWDLAQAFADSEWHDHALTAGWSWNELYGDDGVVWDIIPETVISVSARRFIKVDKHGYAETIYREGSWEGDDLVTWAEPLERAPPKVRRYAASPEPKLKPGPTHEEFLRSIGYRLDGTHVSDGKAYSR